MRIEQFLISNAERQADKTALVMADQRFTYAQLNDLSDRLAATLADNGVQRNDRVLVFMDNCWEAVVSIFAILKAGAVFSPINASTKADKLAFIVADCEPAAILTLARLMPVVTEALGEQSDIFVASTQRPDGQCPPQAVSLAQCLMSEARKIEHGGIDIDLAMLIYTSGSTGRPKGVMMTHRNCDAAAASITTYLENTPDDIILNVLPLAFDYGLYQLLMSVRLGATLVLEKSFAFPQAIFERVRKERVTGLPLVPTMAAMIMQMRDLQPGFLHTLRYVTNTAAALPVSHIERLQALLPGVQLYSMYGLTECKRCTYLPPEQLGVRPDSVGIAIPNTEAFVIDDDGNRARPGEVGELIIRGPHVMQGYWRNDTETRRVLRPDPVSKLNPAERVLYTGDLFRADEEGFLYFVGRKDDIIKTRGEKVAPKEVEAVLHAHEAIAEAVVVGLPDPVLGQAISAFVVRSDPALSEKEVIRHCARHLEDFMVPKSIEFCLELPKTDTGKVSRRLAAELAEAKA
ncbi:class I adenylate-forming enzyme family protein [Aquamicrobium segne]|uniref:Class I adenylate-forming enzyme family protein n=1 Tax=Aquamicrobium segne TaxID=469547 RepID=A0ABW0GYK5_9HYPH